MLFVQILIALIPGGVLLWQPFAFPHPRWDEREP